MNAFANILNREIDAATQLGNPSEDYAAHQRRMNAMATMTGTHGFRVPPLAPKTDSQGKTRGQRYRELRAKSEAKVSEERAPKFLHRLARRHLEPA